MASFEEKLLQAREDIKQVLELDDYITETKQAKKVIDNAIVQVVKEILKENE